MRITVEYLSAQALRRRNMGKLRTVLSYVPPGAAHETTNQSGAAHETTNQFVGA
jgi:hypothetical protein